MIENIEPSTNNEQEMLLGKPRPICLGCKDAAGIEAVQKDLQLEREKTAQLESIIMSLASKLETYRHLAKTVLDLEAKNDGKVANLQELYRRTSSIEAHQVASDLDEATELEGRQDANYLEREKTKKRTWRRTGMKNLSTDFREVF